MGPTPGWGPGLGRRHGPTYAWAMPELPEVEAVRQALDDPVRAFPIERAGPAHVATLKTIHPPLQALEGRRLAGAARRGKRLLFETEDGELVLMIHLMSAGRLRYLRAGEKGPKTPAFRLRFQGGGELVLTEAGSKKRAGVWLLTPEQADEELAHLGPEALGIGAERLAEILAAASRRLHPLLRDQRAVAGIGRAWSNEILHTARLSPFALSTQLCRRGDRAPRPGDRRGARARPRAAPPRRRRREDLPDPRPPRRTLPRVRDADRARRLRGAHDLLLPVLPDRGKGAKPISRTRRQAVGEGHVQPGDAPPHAPLRAGRGVHVSPGGKAGWHSRPAKVSDGRASVRSGAMGLDAPGGHEETIRGFGLGDEDLAAWRASGSADDAFVDWLTDRVARRPSGLRARQVYGAEDVHEFARRAILDALALGPGDHVLDLGCGGGLLLRDALAQGARATGLDHSEEMVSLARERAPGSTVVLAEAETLPFEDATFSAVSMSIVFFFLADPVGVLRECRRVLRPGGRLAIFTSGPELRGTPAAPEPLASRGHFYTDAELAELARRCGSRRGNSATRQWGSTPDRRGLTRPPPRYQRRLRRSLRSA